MKSLLERFARPAWVRRVNLMADAVGGAEHMIPLSVDELLNSVRQSTGLEDFGDDIDGDWHGRLQQLVRCLNTEAQLSVVGRLQVRQELLRCLRTRQFLAQKLKAQPAIRDEVIREPIIITGTGRSGTSITLELLSLDPDCHAPIAWQALHPAAATTDPEALQAISECEEEFWSDVTPELSAIHELRADLPEECIAIQKPSFAGMFWWVLHDLKTWPMDLEAAMQFHKLALQALQYGKPDSTWVLKTPTYLPMLDLLFAVYPDAWLVLNHRDPMKTTPSGVSTLVVSRWIRSDAVNLEELLPMVTSNANIELMLDIHRRRASGELPARFIDLHFSALMEDPVAAIKDVYATMNRPFHDTHARAIVDYLQAKPKGKFGKHDYSLEEWGVQSSTVREYSEPYLQAYGIRKEE